jgi:hypothetical protein
VRLSRIDKLRGNAEQPVVGLAIAREPGLDSSARNLWSLRQDRARKRVDACVGRDKDISYHRDDGMLRRERDSFL